MNNDKYSVIFLGGSTHVIPVIEILNNLFNLKKVIIKSDNDPLISYCKKNEIEYSVVKSPFELEEILKDINPIVGITANFGMIFSKSILNLFPKGILNIHPSLLPKFRGPTPVQTAIINGETLTGVTLFKLDDEIDHGPIVSQEEFEIPENFSSQELLITLFKLGAKLIEDNLEDYLNDDIILEDQNHSLATFTKTLKKEDGYINLESSKLKVENLKLKINGMFPWPGVWTEFEINKNGSKKIIKLLPNDMIQVEGKNPMSYKDFKNGYENGDQLLKKLNLN